VKSKRNHGAIVRIIFYFAIERLKNEKRKFN